MHADDSKKSTYVYDSDTTSSHSSQSRSSYHEEVGQDAANDNKNKLALSSGEIINSLAIQNNDSETTILVWMKSSTSALQGYSQLPLKDCQLDPQSISILLEIPDGVMASIETINIGAQNYSILAHIKKLNLASVTCIHFSFLPMSKIDPILIRNFQSDNTNNLRKLIKLHLENSELTPNHIQAFLQLKMPKLKNLFLSNNPMSDAGMAMMKDSNLQENTLCTLTHLNISHCQLSDESLQDLSLMHLPLLEKLYIGGNSFTDIGFHHLSKTGLNNLNTLSVNKNSYGISLKSLVYLTTMSLKKLVTLHMSQNNICAQGLQILKKWHLPSIQSIGLGMGNDATDRILANMRSYWTGLHFAWNTITAPTTHPVYSKDLKQDDQPASITDSHKGETTGLLIEYKKMK